MNAVTAIDLFAGFGGFTTGARMAGANVIWAGNHSPVAVAYHHQNNPETTHVCQDLHQANWSEVPAHDVMLASPCCQGHARARGKDRPHHDASRSTAWAVVSCAEYHKPPFIIVENVPEFQTWQLYPAWLHAMTCLGYSHASHVVDAADFGVPQHRVRLFMVFSRSKTPLRLSLPREAHVAVRSVIEWDSYAWSPIDRRGRSKATLERVANGRARFGDEFVMPYYGSGSGTTGRSLDRPLGTITVLDRWAIVRNGQDMRMLQPPEIRSVMGFPSHYRLPEVRRSAIALLGNAVVPKVGCAFVRAVMQQG